MLIKSWIDIMGVPLLSTVPGCPQSSIRGDCPYLWMNTYSDL